MASWASSRHASYGPHRIAARPARRGRAGRHASPIWGSRQVPLGRLSADRRLGPALIIAFLLVTSLFAILPPASAHVVVTGYMVNPGIADLRAAQARGPSRLIPSSTAPTASATTASSGASFAEDGTLLVPLSVQPAPATFQLRLYTVRSGDTLTGIASRSGLSMMSIWWANTLTSKDQLRVGEVLIIPPLDGVLYIAQEGDTVAAAAARFHADPAAVLRYNGLATDELTLGQQVMIPNGVGSSIAVVAAAKSTVRGGPRAGGTVGCTACSFAPLAWPVPGGYISQGFGCTGFPAEPPLGSCPHFHSGIDIAAPSGTPIVAAAAGTVTFAGWKSNGGGYQVWISDGNDFYTSYHHMSAVLVHVGQRVGRGQLIGRVGMTGNATGSHCHFSVWIGPIWAGGHVVNPLNYF